MVSEAIPISSEDASQIGQARRRAASLAKAMGFDEVRAGELSIIVTEAASNIAAHAGAGTLILAPWTLLSETVSEAAAAPVQARQSSATTGIDVYALDRASGIGDIERAGQDGYSTSGTAGQGLGAILRLAYDLQIYSVPSQSSLSSSSSPSTSGTVLFSRVLRDEGQSSETLPSGERSLRQSRALGIQFGAISVPLSGESVSGDAWSSSVSADRSVHLVVDGLGHGPLASEAAAEAVRVFRQNFQHAPERILKEMHAALNKTRGAAVAVAEVLPFEGVLNFSGAGNIAAAIYSGNKTKSLVSMNGTVGHSVAKFQQFSYPWERNSTLIMHSDGLQTRWNVEKYLGLGSHHPALIAAILFRDFRRERDDATVLVTR